MIPLMWFAAALRGWLQHEQGDVIAFLREENRVLKAQLRGRRLRLSDPERRRLAALGHRLGRRALTDVATIVSPDTILRWHRELVVRQSMYARRRGGRPRLEAHIRSLVVRMAGENATWGYTRIQGALKNLGHRTGRSTIARILKAHGIPPSRHRPTEWRTFVRAHWPALLDFFMTDVPKIRGWVPDYASLTIDLRSRRVTRLSSTLRSVTPLLAWNATGHEQYPRNRGRGTVRAMDERGAPGPNGCGPGVSCPTGTNIFVAHNHSERTHHGPGTAAMECPRGQHLDSHIRRGQRLGKTANHCWAAA